MPESAAVAAPLAGHPDPAAAGRRAPGRRPAGPQFTALAWMVSGGIAAVIVVLDQATKLLAEWHLADGPIDLGVVALNLVYNPNAAFGIPGFPGMFVLVTLIVLGVVARLVQRAERLDLPAALGLIAGGALGNGIDRVSRPPGFPDGAVVDFIDLGWFPVFNVADSAITVGAGSLMLVLVLADRAERRAAAAAPTAQPQPPAQSDMPPARAEEPGPSDVPPARPVRAVPPQPPGATPPR